jgi:hypothetical protein
MNTRHSSFIRFVANWKATWLFIVHIISIATSKRFRKTPHFIASSEDRIDHSSVSRLPHVSSSNREDEIFNSQLVQSIRETSANIEKISDYEWEDMENQDPEDVF